MSDRSEFITAFDTKHQKEVQITRKMQSILPKRYLIGGAIPEKKNHLKENAATPVAGKKPKIIRNEE